MRFSVLALLAGAVACSSYSTTNLITPDEDGFAGATTWTSEASEQGGASATASSNATATTAMQLATGGAVSAGGATVVATGGTQAENSSAVEAGGTTPASIGYGGSSAATVLAFGGSLTGGASTVANECSAIYAPCGSERTCTDFSRVPYGTCFYGSFFCGKYIVWYYEGGPVSACNHTEKGCSPATELNDYYQSNCSTGSGGASGVGEQHSGGGAVINGGSSATGGTTAKSTSVADCSVKSNEMPCSYHNDPSDPSKCIGEPLPNITTCASFLKAACNGAYGASECLHACSECSLWGSDSPKCGTALEGIPRDIASCSKLYPEL